MADIPDWLGGAVIAAVAAALGFLAKAAWEALMARRRRGSAQVLALHELLQVLEDSKSVFQSQNYLARRLMSMLRNKHPDRAEAGLGFDETFFRLFPEMDAEERELQALIRGTTLNSMRTLNQSLRDWLRAHREFRSSARKSPPRERLAAGLQQLELHLNQWFDKYEAIIPGNERRSLVYLADEKQHGVGFPRTLESSVTEVLAELS